MRNVSLVDSLCIDCVWACGYTPHTILGRLHPVNNYRVLHSVIRYTATHLSAAFYSFPILLQRVLHRFHSTNNNHHLYVNHIMYSRGGEPI